MVLPVLVCAEDNFSILKNLFGSTQGIRMQHEIWHPLTYIQYLTSTQHYILHIFVLENSGMIIH